MATLYRMLLNTKHCYIIYQHRITFNYEKLLPEFYKCENGILEWYFKLSVGFKARR